MQTLDYSRSMEHVPRKAALRILPFLFILYIIAFLDRANVGFAKLQMMAEPWFNDNVFGTGAGLFFVGYLVLEIPGTLLVERWSARKWISRILISWGLCTVVIGFVHSTRQFYLARFLLGVAEAGFYPGIIVYLTHWFTTKERGRAMSGLIVAIPVSLVIGGPLSAMMMQIHWFNLAGWRWLFILQGLPAVIFGIITLFYMTDHPHQAKWLEPDEREWLASRVAAEKRLKMEASGHISIGSALGQRQVILLALSLCMANVGSLAFVFWLPTIIKNASHLSESKVVLLTMIPYGFGLISVLLSGRVSDASGERKLHTAIPLAMAAIFFVCSAIPGQPFWLVMTWLCLTAVAGNAWPPSFWVLPTMTLTASAAAAAIGLINSVGNLGGYIGNQVTGYLKNQKYQHLTCILFLSTCYLVAAGLVMLMRVKREDGHDKSIA